MPFVTVQGRNLHYIAPRDPAHPQGTVLLMIHGLGGGHWMFLPQLEHFARQHTPIALELPGHGASEGEGAACIEVYREVVREFMDALGLSRPVLCGHSMGGAIVLDFALAYPDRLAAAILIGAGAEFEVPPERLQLMRQDFARAMTDPRWPVYSTKTSPELIQRIQAARGRVDPVVTAGDVEALATFKRTALLPDVRVPVLAIFGVEDRYVGQAIVLKRYLPSCRLVLIEDSAHITTWGKPAATNAAIAEFLAAL